MLTNFEKSVLLAQMYLKTGTFGYVPGHPVCLHPAALRLVPDRRHLDRGLPLVVDRRRPDPRRGRDVDRRLRDRAALPLEANRPAGSRDRDPAALPRLARHPRQPRDPRPAARRGRLRLALLIASPPLPPDRRGARNRLGRRDPLEHAARAPPVRARCLPALAERRLGDRCDRAGARRGGDVAVGRPQQGRARMLGDHDRRPRALEGEQPQHLLDARRRALARPGARHPPAANGQRPPEMADGAGGR